MKICPICDTENQPQATHCDVCGERLTPPGPGEEIPPEENVMAQLEAELAAASAATTQTVAVEPEGTPEPIPAPAAAAPKPARPAPAHPAAAKQTEPAPRIVSSGIPDARLVVYVNREPTHTHPLVNDETLIGRYDPISGSYPDLDLTEFDVDSVCSRKHAYIYRQNRSFTLYPISNAGTQLGSEIVEMGQKRRLSSGDVIVLAGKLAMKFYVDDDELA